MTVYNGNGKLDRPGPFMLSGLINDFFKSNYNPIELYYDSPIVVDDVKIPRNTSLMTYFPEGAPQSELNVYYNRVLITDALGDQDLTIPDNGLLVHTHDLLATLNTRFALSLNKIDVVNEPLNLTGSYPQTITLNLTDWSYVYLPGTLDVQIVAPTTVGSTNVTIDPLFVKADGTSLIDGDADVGHYVRAARCRAVLAARARVLGQAVPDAPGGTYTLAYSDSADWAVDVIQYVVAHTAMDGSEDYQPLLKITRAGAPGEEVQLQWSQNISPDSTLTGFVALNGSSTPIADITENILFQNIDQLTYMQTRLLGSQLAALFPTVSVNSAGAPMDTFTFHLQLYKWLGNTYPIDQTFTVVFEGP